MLSIGEMRTMLSIREMRTMLSIREMRTMLAISILILRHERGTEYGSSRLDVDVDAAVDCSIHDLALI